MKEQNPAAAAALAQSTSESHELSENGQKITVRYLVRALIKYNGSDLHIKVGRPPLYRINGKLVPAKMPELSQEQAKAIVFGILSARQISDLEEKRQIDLSFYIPELGRFRANVFYQRGQVSCVIRMIPFAVPNIDELMLPAVIKELCARPRGLLLVTGATGSGKSTTLASMIQYLNETKHCHILSIEDPIEFVYRDIKASISQREIGADANSFQDALYAGLRQDPDVIVVGEMRDRETIQAALTAAETGHLVMSTLHTNDVKNTIDRIMDVFPSDAQNQIRIQLASSLVGVISQRLLVRADRKGRIPACEIMVKSPTIENCILRNERERIPEAIASSSTYYKMQTMNMALEKLVNSGLVTPEEATRHSNNPEDLALRLSGIKREEGYQQASAWQDVKADPNAQSVEIEETTATGSNPGVATPPPVTPPGHPHKS